VNSQGNIWGKLSGGNVHGTVRGMSGEKCLGPGLQVSMRSDYDL